MKIKTIIISLAGCFILTADIQSKAQPTDSAKKILNIDSVMIAKNFPLLSLVEQDKDLKQIILKDKTFQKMARRQYERANNALDTCQNPSCYVESLQWIPAETDAAGSELIKLYAKSKVLKAMVRTLIKGGSYNLYASLPDTAFLRHGWNDAAQGINYVLAVYGQGKKPVYAEIDGISFVNRDSIFKNEVQNSMQSALHRKSVHLFFGASLQMAINVLEINGRDECARYEPLRDGLNRVPYSTIKSKDWKSYQYSMILVPGLGPETPGVSLDPGGAKR